MPTRKRFARLDFLFGKAGASAGGRSRRALHVERLEDRRVMNVDNPLAGRLAAADGAASVTAPIMGPSAVQAPENFESREDLRQWLIQVADQQWGDLFGQKSNPWVWFADDWNLLDGGMTIFRTMLASAATTNDASGTNVQVEGVDEADLVETDGEYLYIISGQDLVIVKAGVGDELQIASRIRLDGAVTGMYLDGDRLALISNNPQEGYAALGGGLVRPMLTVGGFFTGDIDFAAADMPKEEVQRRKPTTIVTLLDVSDRTAPTLVKKSEFDGRLVASRAVDGQLRLVVANDFHLPQPNSRWVGDEAKTASVVPAGDTLRADSIDYYYPRPAGEYVYETRQEYIDRVVDALLDDLPKLRELGLDGEVIAESGLVFPDDIFRPDGNELGSLTTIATIDMHGSGSVIDAASVLASQPATVYATSTHLYLSAQADNYYSGTLFSSWLPATNIWKFGFHAESHDVRLAARGRVEGTVLNQFAVDEHEGYLRVVTRDGWGQGQRLSVLQQSGKRLSVVGKIEGIAPGEALHSVRFMGDRAFAVTFRQVDPLFAFDLSDPRNPVIAGELKIPGYSEYLQPLDATHLIGIGRGAEEASGFFAEMQISIFDVADLGDPQLIHRYSFDGGRSTASIATGDRWTTGDGDHHAVSYFAAEQILAVPIYSDDGSAWWSSEDVEPIFEPGEGGLQVFHIDVAGGLQPTALIEHDTPISRAVRVGDHLYALSPGTVTVHSLLNPSAQLGELAIAGAADDSLTPLRMYVAEQTVQAMTMAFSVLPEASGEDAPPNSVDSFISPAAPSLALQYKIGRDAAISQLASARSFGDVHVPCYSPLTASVLRAVDQAFDEPTTDLNSTETQVEPFGEGALMPTVTDMLA